jgi:hypothetical protein
VTTTIPFGWGGGKEPMIPITSLFCLFSLFRHFGFLYYTRVLHSLHTLYYRPHGLRSAFLGAGVPFFYSLGHSLGLFSLLCYFSSYLFFTRLQPRQRLSIYPRLLFFLATITSQLRSERTEQGKDTYKRPGAEWHQNHLEQRGFGGTYRGHVFGFGRIEEY